MGIQTTIATEVELRDAVWEHVRATRVPGCRLSVAESAGPHEHPDLLFDVDLDGRQVRFAVECKVRPAANDLRALKERDSALPPLLAAPHLPEPLVARCREAGISCLDLNGRLFLRQPGLLVDRQPTTKRFRSADPERELFSGKSSRLARVLLSFPGRAWKQADLADFTECSTALISRLVREYARVGWVEGKWGDWTLTKPDALLDAWAAADSWKKRASVRQYSALDRDPNRLARAILDHSSGSVAFTQWFAAARRFPYTELDVVSVYRTQFLRPEESEALGFREVGQGGRLWVIVPRDKGVFQAIRKTDEGFPLVCDVQIYLDLLQVGLRGPDAAKALREWEGFRQ